MHSETPNRLRESVVVRDNEVLVVWKAAKLETSSGQEFLKNHFVSRKSDDRVVGGGLVSKEFPGG